jgi:8-oxo-dGTP diphosphatase
MYMRNRSSAILIENDCIGLIKRNRDELEYYVFPGEGIEIGETPEETAVREVFEELGVTIRIEELLTMVPYNGTQNFFIAKILAGEFGTGKGEEFGPERNRGTYLPAWVPIAELDKYEVLPKEVITALRKRQYITE